MRVRVVAVLAVVGLTGSGAPPVAAGAPGAPGAAAASGPPVVAIDSAGASSGAGHAVAPVPGAVVRGFEPPAHPFGPGHRGVALAADPGDAVVAALPGRVHFAGEVARRGWVTVDHGAGLHTTYGWLDSHVRAGQRVRTGTLLGWLDGEASHLHWGARLAGEYIDPLTLLTRWEVHLVPVD